MATNTVVGSVAGIRMFPVKSMRGERLEQGELTERGLVGDRAYALIDADTAVSRTNWLQRRICRAAAIGWRAATSADHAAGWHIGDQRF